MSGDDIPPPRPSWMKRTFDTEMPKGTGIGCMTVAGMFVVLGLLGVSHCSSNAPPVPQTVAVNSTSASPGSSDDDPTAIMSAAEINLKANLKDATGAKLRKLVVSKLDNGAYVLCGEVNAKNGFGGYAGYTRFISSVNPDAPTLIEGQDGTVGDEIFTKAHAKFCRHVVKRFTDWRDL